jgi:hypothetical protein
MLRLHLTFTAWTKDIYSLQQGVSQQHFLHGSRKKLEKPVLRMGGAPVATSSWHGGGGGAVSSTVPVSNSLREFLRQTKNSK